MEAPDEYEKESWQLDAEEKLGVIPTLKEEGNRLVTAKDFISLVLVQMTHLQIVQRGQN